LRIKIVNENAQRIKITFIIKVSQKSYNIFQESKRKMLIYEEKII